MQLFLSRDFPCRHFDVHMLHFVTHLTPAHQPLTTTTTEEPFLEDGHKLARNVCYFIMTFKFLENFCYHLPFILSFVYSFTYTSVIVNYILIFLFTLRIIATYFIFNIYIFHSLYTKITIVYTPLLHVVYTPSIVAQHSNVNNISVTTCLDVVDCGCSLVPSC